MLEARATSEEPLLASIDYLVHECELRSDLESSSAGRPRELIRDCERTMLQLDDPGGQPLDRLLGAPMETGSFLRLARAIAVALGKFHQCGFIHKDLKPTNILVNRATGEAKLTGFGLASRFPRERRSPERSEIIAGTLAYMAPEQTGRMNRSIDSRSDLYALGVTFYEMLTGSLPFRAAEAIEWIHCHIARKPQPPSERVEGVPAAISAIVMKLLAKMAEDRYQTAAGLERDLRRCLSDWETLHRADPFPLGEHDIPNRLLVPEKLYGRERDIDTLLAAFDSVLANGAPELVLVCGYSGIGKSAVVNELHKVLVLPRGLFAFGKFDQYKLDIPYATLAQAFQRLTRQLLGQTEAELAKWREDFAQALGPNGLLIADLVPELKLIIGEQPPISELPPQEAKKRFQLVFRRFISVFASAEHPLALFLDDLQWLDAATLELIEHLLTEPDVHHLLLIGAYRDNEVDAAHPLMRRLEAIRQGGAKTRQITLTPLHTEDLRQLVADTLHSDPEQAAPLAQLIREKTAANPFFVIQFISTLVDEGLLAFDHATSHWRWDLSRVEAKAYTDNVVDLMVHKLNRLPVETQSALQQLACLGNSAGIERLSMVQERSEEKIHADLWEARRTELIARSEESYRFVHDRIREAAYSLIPGIRRAEVHLRIGRLLAARTPPEKRDEAIFEIVNQLNRGVSLITSRDEREQVAELNLIAGKRAHASAAYISALGYFEAGAALLADDCWTRRHELAFALELGRSQCEFVTGAVVHAEEHLAALWIRSETMAEQTRVACLRIDLYMAIDQSEKAVLIGLDQLRQLGIEWSARPDEEEARREYKRIWALLGDRKIEDLIELPLMDDPASLATLEVLIRIAVPAFFSSSHLWALAVCRAVSIGLQHGHSDASCMAYELLARLAGPLFGDYDAGYRFGRLGCDLVDQCTLTRFQARTYVGFGMIIPWTRHIRDARDLLFRAFEIANRVGDITYACYAINRLAINLLMSNDPLANVQKEVENGLEFAQKARFGLIVGLLSGHLALIRMLRGATVRFGSFNCAQFDEREFERQLAGNPALARAVFWYWMRKLQACFFDGDYNSALGAASRAQPMLGFSLSPSELPEFHFYSALCRAASCDSASAEEQRSHFEALVIHQKQLAIWAKIGPENFENRALLIGAEIARIEERELDAERLYEAAIKSARENEFVHNEALANELAARFYALRGFETIARAYLREARSCYLRWGAEGKVRQLEALHPYLREGGSTPAAVATTASRLEQLDFATVVKVSQAVSSEILPEKLIETLMRTAIEQAGAERGLLIISRAGEPRIAAEATTDGDAIVVQLCDEAVVEGMLPESVLQYVLRTHESFIVDDAATQATFAADPYVRQHRARSILCLPLLNQAKLIGALFLENHLAPGVFAPTRIAILRLVSMLAAIALENSRLYGDLREREAKIRRLVDANIIGILIIDFDGRIIEANDKFLRMVGYEREDFVSGGMRWTELTPLDWHAADAERVRKVKMTGTLQAFEKEYFRKNGSRVPVLVGVARFEETGNQAVAFVLDLTERKRAELEAYESERRFREAQIELAHASRVVTMGQLTASIAHEVNQPLTATIGNAEAALRWLARQPPNLEETRQLLGRIVKDGRRASNVVRRIRDLTKKAPPRMERMEINGAIGEVIELTRGEAMKKGVSVQTQLADGLPLIEADRIQLQQVTLNLIINAIQAFGEGGIDPRELLISTSVNGSDSVAVTVRDSGPGLSPEGLARLFDPFYTTKPDGMGMGLSICQSIIESHKGRIWATANVPRGAAFHFTIPIARQ